MNAMNADNTGLDSLSERVLGAGFLEKVFQRALLRDLSLRGIRATAEASFADLLVEDVPAVELKCAERLANEHMAQCLTYLRASGLTLCLLVNFQKPQVGWRRVVLAFQAPETPLDTIWPVQFFRGHCASGVGVRAKRRGGRR